MTTTAPTSLMTEGGYFECAGTAVHFTGPAGALRIPTTRQPVDAELSNSNQVVKEIPLWLYLYRCWESKR